MCPVTLVLILLAVLGLGGGNLGSLSALLSALLGGTAG
jgi:hypothetical protein